MSDLNMSLNKDKILDLILANQIEMREDISKIKESVSKMNVIEHRLSEGSKKFEEFDIKIKEINMKCYSDGCMNPHLVTVMDKLKRHIGDMDYFFEKLNKTVEGERFYDILEDVAKNHIKSRNLAQDLKTTGIKNLLGWVTKIGITAIGIGIIAMFIMFGIQILNSLSKLAPLINKVNP